MAETPVWLEEAESLYQTQEYVVNVTSFARGNVEIEVLDREVIPNLDGRLKILLVGAGIGQDDILCCLMPYRIAAHLEGKGIDYEMTIVDLNPKVIEDLRTREELFVAGWHFGLTEEDNLLEEWNKYLADTGQTGEIIHERREGLVFLDYIEERVYEPHITPESYLEEGVFCARVPASFTRGLEEGRVTLIHSDIADPGLELPEDYFDFTSCYEVLYQCSQSGQMLAMMAMALSLNERGVAVVSDRKSFSAFERLMQQNGGWCGEVELVQLGLSANQIGERDSLFLLRKPS